MKKIFTHLFAVLLLSFVATSNVWAQETTEIPLNFSDGTCGSGNSQNTYCSSWSSATDPVVTISVEGGNNNLVVNPSSGNFEMHEGQNGSTWTFSVTGYRIVSYSFTYKTKQTGNDVTITIGETTYTSSDFEQSLEIAGLDSPTASFSLSGNNYGVVVSNLVLKVYKHSSLTALEEGCVYMFKNARADRSLRADGAGDVHTKATDANDTAQQWYVTKENGYYILRNVAYGKYLNGASSSGTAWSLTDDYSATGNKFELYTSNYETLNTLKTYGSDDYGYMHDDANANNGCYNVVGWLNGNTNTGSHWTITKVDYTAEQITALLEKAPTVAEIAGYTTALGELFTDAACVTPALGSLSAAQASDAYKALPTGLKAMVDKVYNEKTEGVETAWAEDNANDEKKEGNLNWSGDYAKKFRVQMYEPYSIAGDITSWLGINAHANNDNPTGIYVPEAGTLYVMVEGTINVGATLRIVDGGHNNRVTNATGGGYALKSGLNVINYTGTAGMLYICYNVDTYNPDGTDDATRFPHKLSEYPPLKIHIEGGAINGYYNACGDFLAGKIYDSAAYNEDLWGGVDDDNDWIYMETRANLSVLPLLAHRQILLFQLEDLNSDKGMKTLLPDLLEFPEKPYNYTEDWNSYEGMGLNTSTGRINIMLEAWDRIMYSELATMGLVSQSTMAQMNAFYPRWESDYTTKYEMYDYENESAIDGQTYLDFCGVDYSDVFNHHGVALGTESGYMYGGWDHCGYHINTFGGIVQNMANNAGSTWGPAHEIGHQHQALLTLNGLTEVTNNLFSNIALWYKGMSTSRYNGSNGSLESVLNAYNTEGSDIYTNNIWALTHLYYRLWLYYHLAGNNTQFYPRLFELLRHNPMQKGYNVSGDKSTLHFYKLACQAAGEDLTEFFRAHGYFSIMDDRLVGDYANSVYEVSQKMINDAIAEVKAMTDANGDPLKENLAIIFICDDDENATYVQHDGETERDIYGETTSNSDFGSVSDFINGNVSVEPTYTATLNSDGTLTMSGGEGGVGFLVLNEDGEIVSFSNKSKFALSDEAAYLLATGKASVVAVDTESTTTEAEVDVTAMRFALLQELIEKATALTQNTSETRVGFYKTSAVTNLQAYITMAQGVIDNDDLANLQAVYELLYAEYNAVVANEFSRVVLVPGSKFAIISVKSNDRILTYSGSNVTTVSGDADDYSSIVAYQWYIERDGAYYIKNAGTSKYIQDVTDQNGVLYTVGDNKVNMNINEVALGCYTIATSNVPGRYMNMDGADSERIITWGDAYSENSQWAFILLEADDTNKAKEELLELSKKTLALVNEVATVSYNEGSKIELQTNSGNANYIWSNAAVSGNDVDKLLDSDIGTYFHSQWNNSTAPTDGWGHHLTVDLGENPSLTSFKFKFTTRNEVNLSNYPKTIEVYGSNDNSTYTKLQVASGFATGAGVDNEAVVMGNGTAYRYLRFLVTDATGNNAGTNTGSDGKVFFHMSEFSIYPVTVSATVKSDYTPDVTVEAVLAAYNDAEQGKTVYNNASATIDDINAKKTALGDGADVAGSYTTLLNLYKSVLNSVLEAKRTELQKLINNTKSLIESVGGVEFNDENQPVVTMTNTSTKADEALVLDTYLATTKSEKLYNDATTVALLDAAIADQQAAYDELDKAIKTPAVLDKSGLEELVALAQPLYNKMATDGVVNVDYAPSALTNAQLTAASDALAAANEALASATSQAALDEAKATLQTAYGALLAVENANEKNTITTTDLSTLIGSVEELLERVATTGTSKGEIALQAGNANSEFYIWSNAPASDCNGYSNKVEGLIDVNEDGSANTGTFFGTDWGSAVVAYTHYLEVDLGVATSINKLSMDYTTRASGYENQRPTAIKILGSNNKVDYTEVTTIEEGLATGACEQWAMETPLELGARYRYIRFAVATQDTTGYFNMSDFNLYSISDRQFSDYYSTADADLNALLLALEVAKDALSRHYLTSAQYTAIKEKLNSVYNDVNDVIALDYTTRDDLTKLIDDTETLIEKVATVTEVVTPVLSTTNLYCNADNSTNASAGDSDKLGVAALLDGKVSTHLHTTYGNNAQDDDLDHYIRVDMGDDKAVAAFEFSYTGRSVQSGNDPSTIIIQGCNTVDGEWDDIKTLTNLPTDGDKVQYSSGLIEASKAYRYIRFMVTETENNSHTTYNGIQHKFFVMSEFSFTAYPTVEVAEGFINVTKELVRAAYDEKNTATAENGHYMTESDYNAALDALQADYDALNVAKNLSSLPVKLTTDVNNPVLYKIQIKSNENVFTYEGEGSSSSKKPVLAADKLGNRYQAWYFMQGTNSESYEDILILPYFNEGQKNTTLRLSYANNNNGTEPAVVASGTNTTDNWYITFTEGSTTDGWWNLQPEGGASVNAYVNQYGGSSSTTLAFWRSTSNPSDAGSQFRFVLDETDYSPYYALLNQYNSYSEIEGGTAVGTYTTESANAYMEKYNAAGALVEAKNATDDEYNAAREELVTAYEALVVNMPEEGKFYVLRNVGRVSSSVNGKMYADGEKELYLKWDYSENVTSKHIFTFEPVDDGTFYLKSLERGTYLSSQRSAGVDDVANAKAVKFSTGFIANRDRELAIIPVNEKMLHCDDSGVKWHVVGWNDSDGTSLASYWYIDEVTDLSQIVHTVTMSAKFSSVMLGYNATVPAGVEAYIATGINGGYVSLEKVAELGETLPAGTPVILYRTDDETSKVFTYSEETPVIVDGESVLGGSLFVKYVECDTDKNYYKLMLKDGEAKMYWMYKEFDANGVSQGKTDDGGHIKCSANKIYMALQKSGSNPVTMYGMRFIDDSATGIEEMKGENGEVKAIYDLQGRKLTEITEPGMYIVDGKKVYVK